MADEIHVVRIVTISSITFEFYYKTEESAGKAVDKVVRKMKSLEKETADSAPAVYLLDMSDEYGIRQVIDLRGVAAVIHTNTKASADTAMEIDAANQKAQNKGSTGFTSGVVVAQPPR